MKAFIIYNESDARYNQRYIDFYIEEGKHKNIDIRLLLVENINFGVYQNTWYLKENGVEIEKPDFVICRTIYPLLSKQLEYMGIKVFNNSFVSEICNDKARTYQFLAHTGIRMIDTEFCKNNNLPLKLDNIRHRAVIKTVNGHGGKQVFLYDKNIDTTNIRNENADFVIQPLVGNRNQDLRVYVIGKTIIAAVLRTAKEGFKSNFSLGGDVCLYELNEQEIHIISRIIQEFDFGLVGIDFLIGDDGSLIFNEIEDVVGARMLYQCSDINIVALYLEYIIQSSSDK